MGCQIAELPVRDRPRERLERLGTSALTDAELVALILRSGARGTSALALAERVLADAGGLGGLAKATTASLARGDAMGIAKASALLAALELGRRAVAGSAPEPITIRDAADIAAVARRELTDPSREAVVVLVVNSGGRLIKTERLTVGTDTRCLLDPRDVLRAVIASGGTGFAVAHNHPSIDPSPSAEDRACTERLKHSAASVGLRFLDHVIVSPTSWRSVFNEHRN